MALERIKILSGRLAIRGEIVSGLEGLESAFLHARQVMY